MRLGGRARRLAAWALGAVLGAPVLVLACVAWLLGTESGARWAWDLARALTPGALNAEAIHGPLIGPFTITDLRWSAPDGKALALREAGWSLRPAALLDGVLRIDRVHAKGIHYHHVPSGKPRVLPTLPERLRLPVALELATATVEDLSLDLGAGPPVQITSIRLSAHAREALQIEALSVEAAGITLAMTGSARLQSPYPLSAELQWRSARPNLPLQGSAAVRGDREGLTLEARNEAPLGARLEASVALRPPYTFDSALQWTAIRWPLQGDPRFSSPEGRIALRGTLDAWRGQARARVAPVRQPEGGSAAVGLEAALQGGRTQARIERLEARMPQDGRLQAQGSIEWDEGLAWDLRVQADTVDLAPLGVPRLRIGSARLQGRGRWAAGRLQARLNLPEAQLDHEGHSLRLTGLQAVLGGPLQDLGAALDLRAQAEDLPPATLAARARLRPDRAELLSLEADLLNGHLSGSGQVALQGGRSWTANLQARGLDPGTVAPEWSGRLDAEARLRGALPEGRIQVEVESLRVHGRLQDRPLELRAQGGWSDAALVLRAVSLEAAQNRLSAQGRIARGAVDLDLQMDLRRLEGLWPGLRGRLSASAKLAGDTRWPTGTVRLQGEGLAWQDTASLERLDLTADLRGEGQASRVELRAGPLRLRDRRWKALSLALRGRPERHRAVLAAEGDVDLEVKANGSWAGETWTGRLERLALETPATGPWALQRPVQVSAGRERFRLSRGCLRRDAARICLEAEARGVQAWKARGEVRDLPVDWLAAPVLQGRAGAEGRLQADFEAAAQTPIPQVTATARIPGAALVVPVQDQEPVRFPVEDLRAELNADGERAGFRFHAAGPMVRIQAEGEASGFDGTPRTEGRFELVMGDLTFVHAFLPDLLVHAGRLDGEGRWSGPLRRPDMDGRLRLTQLDLEIADLGIRLREGALEATATPQRIDLRGNLRSGEGQLQVDGTIAPDPKRGWPYRLQVFGRDVEFLRTAEILAIASPDLEFRGSTRGLDVTGRVEIPKTVVELAELPPGTVEASADQVIVGEPPPAEPAAPFHARVDVLVILGEDVRFKGFGLETRLGGTLRLLQAPGAPLRGEGVLSFKTGTYRIYGVDLELERGRLLFSGRIDNPALDFRATRTIDDITVGVEVSGTAENPQTHLFSTPPMDDANVLAYLIRGKPLSDAGDVDKDAVLAAAVSMGLGPVTNRIAKQLGIDLTVDTGNNVGETTLGIGRRLNPKLYVEYVVGLFDRTGVFKLTYKLTRHLELVTETGEQQAVDIKYRIESDTWPFIRSSRSKSSTSTTPE